MVILNKIDLIDEDILKEKIENFSKKKKCEILTISTLDKKSVSKIKSKLISYVS